MRGTWAIGAAWLFTLFDVVFTLQYWYAESNPVVLALGPIRFVLLKVGLLVALLIVWAILSKFNIMKGFIDGVVWLYAFLMVLVAIFNVSQAMGIAF